MNYSDVVLQNICYISICYVQAMQTVCSADFDCLCSCEVRSLASRVQWRQRIIAVAIFRGTTQKL